MNNSFWLMLSRACWQTCEEHRLERIFFAFYWKSAFCPAAGTVGSFPTARFFCQHRCSGREAVSISPKQSVVGSTPIGLNPQTSNSFWLMLSRACGKRTKDISWKEFFAFYWKSMFCSAAGVDGSFPTFRLFCQHRCSGKRAICLTFVCAACQQFSALHIFWHYLHDGMDSQQAK